MTRTVMTAKRAPGVVAVVIGLTLALTGCGIFADRAESDVPTATEAEIVQKVNGMADRTAAAIGDAQVINPASNASPCDNNVGDESDAVQFVQGTYNIVLPRAVQQADFQRARDYWKGQGWTINEDWYKQDVHEGSVSAKEVNDGGSLTLVSTDSPTGLAVIAHSGCYRNQNQQQAGR